MKKTAAEHHEQIVGLVERSLKHAKDGLARYKAKEILNADERAVNNYMIQYIEGKIDALEDVLASMEFLEVEKYA